LKGTDVIVIGGGLVGGAIAWGLARGGASVAVLDEGDLAFRASRGNFGLVWVQSKGLGLPPYAHWSLRSAGLWPRLAAALIEATGIDPGLQQPGGLVICLTDAEMEEHDRINRRMHNERGDIGCRMVGRAELKEMVPAIGPRVAGASFCPRDGHANPLLLLRGLHRALLDLSACYLPGRRVDEIAWAGGGFSISCGEETFVAPKIVLAAGLGNARLAPMVGLDMPVHPLRGEIIVTGRMKPFLAYATHVVRQTVEGTVMLGDSQEDVGFDTAVSVPVLRDIAARDVAFFPCLAEATVVRVWSALRVMTPDGFPIYQQSATCPGAFAATCHSGVTLAGAHAFELAPAILAGQLPGKFDAFSSARFRLPPH
jgi:glycine/D-amino acid oxidase-like deaminating enzyme